MHTNQVQQLQKLGYSIEEFAKLLGVCKQTIYNEINNGNLKTFKVGRRRFVSPQAGTKYIADREDATA